MHTCMHACIHRYIHTCMHACIHTCIHSTHRERDIYIYMYIYTEWNVHILVPHRLQPFAWVPTTLSRSLQGAIIQPCLWVDTLARWAPGEVEASLHDIESGWLQCFRHNIAVGSLDHRLFHLGWQNKRNGLAAIRFTLVAELLEHPATFLLVLISLRLRTRSTAWRLLPHVWSIRSSRCPGRHFQSTGDVSPKLWPQQRWSAGVSAESATCPVSVASKPDLWVGGYRLVLILNTTGSAFAKLQLFSCVMPNLETMRLSQFRSTLVDSGCNQQADESHDWYLDIPCKSWCSVVKIEGSEASNR